MKLSFLPYLLFTDNTTLSAGSGGDVIATDDIGGIKFQRNKLVHGSDGVNAGDVSSTNPLPVQQTETVLFKGRAGTYRNPGRAGTAGQKLLSIHNATGSTVRVKVTKVVIDMACTVIKAVTVLPPVVRLWKVTVLPTNGSTLTKNTIGGSTTSNASVTLLQDASADGTNSTTALTATLPTGTIITQEFAPRLITAAGYEMSDRIEFLSADGEYVALNALEGLVLYLDYTLATQNPNTDMWIAGIEWTES